MYDCSSATMCGAPIELEGALLDHPSRLFVETTSRCNQSCVLCRKHRPDVVQRREGDLDLSTFKSLEAALANLDALVLNGTGEPLLNNHLEQFVLRAKKFMPCDSWVGFRSNGILLTNMRAISLVDAGVDRICLSMDGVDVATSGTVRVGSQVLDLEWALKALSSAKSICGRPEVEVGVQYVVEGDNLEELPAALEWAAARGATFAIVSRLHTFATGSSHNLPASSTNEARELFLMWQREAEALGLDITRYFQILWKCHKSPTERKVINIVAAMKGEAQQRGIFLDLKELIANDTRRREEARTVFERAEEVARRTGLDLRLPDDGVRRGGDSPEQEGAFISWDGRMLPCSRLDNECGSAAKRTRCGELNSFGNILERDILDIWNSAPFRSYRESALSRETVACLRGSIQSPPPERGTPAESWGFDSCLWSSGVMRTFD